MSIFRNIGINRPRPAAIRAAQPIDPDALPAPPAPESFVVFQPGQLEPLLQDMQQLSPKFRQQGQDALSLLNGKGPGCKDCQRATHRLTVYVELQMLVEQGDIDVQAFLKQACPICTHIYDLKNKINIEIGDPKHEQ